MDPLDVGERVVSGILSNEAYILSHGEFKDEVREAFAEIIDAFPDNQMIDPKRAALEAMRRQATIDAKRVAANIQ
ncbi:hypothetical protein AS156_18595 [Bradyrhizobium macuxiense]|uniref:Uncharacterized protein n=2 Tax=Bradyrhizobium macuxiense TaxID=1755647 RepID=A0A109JGH7_9BRAD|nr:hypothetical protein AS156_18595 [Bradyrhizobium macuxiense]